MFCPHLPLVSVKVAYQGSTYKVGRILLSLDIALHYHVLFVVILTFEVILSVGGGILPTPSGCCFQTRSLRAHSA